MQLSIWDETSCVGGRHNMPRPLRVDLWLLTLKVVSESRVTWATSVPILVSVLDLGPMYATDRRQTRIIAKCPLPRGGGITTLEWKGWKRRRMLIAGKFFWTSFAGGWHLCGSVDKVYRQGLRICNQQRQQYSTDGLSTLLTTGYARRCHWKP